jgi:chemotaxis protein methyltransferase CheR/type IV pilus assembly protein PilK
MPVVKVDVIYCQNLLIYFKKWLREKIMNAFVERLKPGGILVIGLGEVVDWSHPKMKRLCAEEVQAYVHI